MRLKPHNNDNNSRTTDEPLMGSLIERFLYTETFKNNLTLVEEGLVIAAGVKGRMGSD